MVGEEFGWVPLDGMAIAWLILVMSIVIIIPGFLLSLLVFPKRRAMPMSERVALSFGLGLASPLVVYILNLSFKVPVTSTTSFFVFAGLCAVGLVGFLYRGGNLNLAEWYKSKE